MRTPDRRSSRNDERFGPKIVASMGYKVPVELKKNAGRDLIDRGEIVLHRPNQVRELQCVPFESIYLEVQ